MSSPKFKPDPKRVVCKCQTFKCHSGVYVDASGVQQQGVEVLPATKEAHERADRHSQINQKISDLASPHTTTSSQTAATIDSQESLIGSIGRLRLGPQGPIHSRSRNVPIDDVSHSTQAHQDHGLGQATPDLSNSLMPGSERRPSDTQADPTQSLPQTVVAQDKIHVVDAEILVATDSARENGVQPYNCSRFYEFTLASFNPVCLHVALTAAVMSIFDHSSMSTSAWLLDMMRIAIELSMTHGLVPDSSIPQLDVAELMTLQRFPRTITTAIGWLKLDPILVYMNCCQSCFALYSIERTPSLCNHVIARIPGGPPDLGDANTEISPSAGPVETVDTLDFSEGTCGQPLLRFVRGQEIPV
ncbi:hypothetical protein DFH28DRAFT_862067, partial [Melampsora americana]